jgi:hypothetical protein
MNGKRTEFDNTEDGENFDPALASLFSAANETPLENDAFIRGVMSEVQRDRRRRLQRRIGGTAVALTAGAFAAPFVGEATFSAVDWLAQNVPTASFTFASPAACVLAALITWRITRRAFH